MIVGGQMTSHSGMGGGNVVGTLRHSFTQNLNVEVKTPLNFEMYSGDCKSGTVEITRCW